MDFTIYCMYHNTIWPHLYGRRLADVTFVKLGSHRCDFAPPTRLDLTRFSGFREMGKHYAEYEFFYNLYLAHRNGEVELPEYFGVIQYDMTPRSMAGDCLFEFLQGLEPHPDIFVSFVPRPLSEMRSQKVMMDGADCYAAIVKDYNRFYCDQRELDGDPLLPMCSSFFAHRDLYLDVMEFLTPVIEDGRLDGYSAEMRLQGSLLERYLAVYVALRDLDVRNFPLVHSFVAGTGRTPMDYHAGGAGRIHPLLRRMDRRAPSLSVRLPCAPRLGPCE